MSVYRVIDVVGTSTTSWEEAAADAINTARHRSGTFGSPRSSSRTFTSGTAASSSIARRSSCPSSMRVIRSASAALIAWARALSAEGLLLRGRSRMITDTRMLGTTMRYASTTSGIRRGSRPATLGPSGNACRMESHEEFLWLGGDQPRSFSENRSPSTVRPAERYVDPFNDDLIALGGKDKHCTRSWYHCRIARICMSARSSGRHFYWRLTSMSGKTGSKGLREGS